MTTKTTINITLLFALLLAGSSLCVAVCNTLALAHTLTGPDLDNKESAAEGDFATFTPLQAVQTTGFDANGICGQIWTQAGGTCCDQAAVKARADKLVEKTKAKLTKRWDMIKKGRENLIQKLDTMKTRITTLKGREPQPQPGRILVGEPTKRERFEALETMIDKIKSLNPDDSTLAEEAKAKHALCMQTLVETRVKIWCLACASKDAAATLNTTDYFDANGVLVNQSTCEALITNCGHVFAFMRRVRQADLALRKAKATSEIPAQPQRLLRILQTDLDLEDNSDTELDGDKECVDDIATCKSNNGRRQGMCGRFNLFKDDPKVFGDDKLMKIDPSAIPTRILVGGTPTSESPTGGNVSGMSAGFTVDANAFNDPSQSGTGFASLGRALAIAACLLLNFIF